jgi:hypothetical protein
MRIATAVIWPPKDAEHAVGVKLFIKAETL